MARAAPLDALRRAASRATERALAFAGWAARRGGLAAAPSPPRRRLVVLQIDGLSSSRLERAVAEGEMPQLGARLATGALRLRRLRAATAPSTPVFQAGLLYGSCEGLPGFGWYDRALGRTVRMDLPDDIATVEAELARRAMRPLLRGGTSYGTIWLGDAAEAIFNALRWGRESTVWQRSRTLPRDLFDLSSTVATGAVIAAKLATRVGLELAAGAWDLARFAVRQRTTRFEWRFFYMRAITSVVMRDVVSHAASLDVRRGVPVIYADFLGYDECAHRRGPDSPEALANLRGIDAAIARIARAVDAVPEYRYELYVLSDHGQSATTPFERLMGEELPSFVLRHVAPSAPARAIEALVALRELRFWWRTQRPWARLAIEPYLRRRERRATGALGESARILDDVEVVCGGSIAHLYLCRHRAPLSLEAIELRFPALLAALASCPAVGIVVARSRRGPIALHRGRRYRVDDAHDRAALARVSPRADELLAEHLRAAVASARAGDLVLLGAYARAGNVAFDFELGSHGGVHPDELDQFLVHPDGVTVDLDGLVARDGVRAEAFHRFFTRRHADELDVAV